MRISAKQTVLLTGASGGLGVFMARGFADLGLNLALVAWPGTGLDAVRQEVERRGIRALAFSYDLRDPAMRRSLLEEVTAEFGAVDILVNNAGIEHTCPYHELSEESIQDVIAINLGAAMTLTRLVLPGMLQRGSGHIVNISSLAGKSGPALQEPYAATKAGLVGFTSSLRASYHGTGVSASVIVPGFVEAGIYARLKAKSGCSAPFLIAGSPPERVARAVIRAIQHDRPEVIVNRYPIRPILALSALFPLVGEWVSTRLGVHRFFNKVFEATKTSGAT